MSKKNRFWGLHFDFHADNETEIGANTNIYDIERYITEARPDFIQCDCKGHPGNSCYPTKVGKAADKLKADNLKVWCDAAKKHGIPIYVHYSGVWDSEYVKSHPDEAAVNEDGTVSEILVSLFGNYANNLLIPQLKELIEEYKIDGAWIDGDCWAVQRDYSDNAKPYLWDGITKEEHNKVMHDAFLRYLKHYVDEIHSFAPDFKIASNWAYSSYIPEKPEIDVDFISGDFSPNNSVHEARYESRCMAAQNKMWDLMAWSFNIQKYRTEKSALQLCQESAMALSQGGGFQIYIAQNKDGSARVTSTDKWKEIGDFVRQRKLNYNKKPMAQTGIFYSAESYYKDSEIFNASGATKPLIGALNCVLDAQYTTSIILEYQISSIKDYDAVIIPEWKYINDILKDKFLEYAKNGGNLIILGTDACMQFAEKAGFEFSLTDSEAVKYILGNDGSFMEIESNTVDLKKGDGALYSLMDMRYADIPASRSEKTGKGSITFIPFNLGKMYFDSRTYILTDYIKNILSKLITPIIEINKKDIDITMQKTENGAFVNLINMQQSRHTLDILVYDSIPPVYNIEITINKPCKKITMPLGEKFECEYKDSCTKIKLERLDIHCIISIEY